MAPEDRDLTFEKALARNLRVKAPRGTDSPGHACADAEVLAAYRENSLSPAEMNSWKQHIAGCPRCQSILEHLQVTDRLSEDESLATQKETQGVLPPEKVVLGDQFARPGLLGGGPEIFSASAKPASKVLPFKTRHWLAPLGAIAAVLLIWFAIYETRPAGTEIAQEQPQSSEPAPQPKSVPPAAEPTAPAISREKNPADTKLQSAPDVSVSGLESNDQIPRLRKAKPLQPESGPALNEGNRDVNADALAQISRGDANSSALAGKSNSATQPANQPAKSPSDSLAFAPERKPSLPQSQPLAQQSLNNKLSAPPPIPAATETVEVTPAPNVESSRKEFKSVTGGRAGGSFAATMDKKSTSTLIPTPDKTVVWRVGPAGMIERSSDSGAHWVTQTSGAIGDLLAGSAPSAQICWVAGRAGTILRTTDGGAHWTKIQPPAVEDFTTVFAVDALRVTVRNRENNRSYATVDGGTTWTLTQN